MGFKGVFGGSFCSLVVSFGLRICVFPVSGKGGV